MIRDVAVLFGVLTVSCAIGGGLWYLTIWGWGPGHIASAVLFYRIGIPIVWWYSRD